MNALLNTNERVAVARLHALLELLPAAIDKRLGPAGITGFEYTLLETLSEAGDHRMRLSAIADKTNASLPRVSRVVTSLERRGLVERAACEADGRATNAVLTPAGADAYRLSRELYADAVRDLVLDGLKTLPGDGVAGLSDLSYAILTSLDPARGGTASTESCAADPAQGTAQVCAADPAQDTAQVCAADPAQDTAQV
ncbi:MAG: MarR family transcriptional regulator, partial [Leucobacter sp.]|nr:MarR family transcriptional regulator [Leucobacter sp.]